MNVLYLSEGFSSLSVFKSQVHTVSVAKAEKGIQITILALCDEHELAENIDGYPYAVIRVPRPKAPYVPLIAAFLANDIRVINAISSADIVHCRSQVMTLIAIIARKRLDSYKPPIIADIRGALIAEILERKCIFCKWLAFLAKIGEKRVFKEADAFLFVSAAMESYYRNQYSIGLRPVAVFPTIIDKKYFKKDPVARKQIREEMGFSENDFVFVYCGGTSYWQNLDEVIHTFISINDSTLKLLLILTKPINIENASDKIKQISLPYEKVGEYLCAGDAGIIIRKKSVINEVASPTKINEYAACGLGIIDSFENIKQNPEYIEQPVRLLDAAELAEEHIKLYNKLINKDRAFK